MIDGPLSYSLSVSIITSPARVMWAFFDADALAVWWQTRHSVTIPRVLGAYAVEWDPTDVKDDMLGRLGGAFHGTVMDYKPDKEFFVADAFWLPPDGDPIGRSLWLDRIATTTPGMRYVIVGVAKDSKYLTLGEEGQGHVYLPFRQQPRRGMTVLVRSHTPTDRTLGDLQALLHAVDPQLQGFFPRTLTEHVGVSTLPIRIAASLTTTVALLALGLAVVGLYSLVAFLVAERTHEIGLRMALGAGARDVVRLVLGYGVKLAGIGLAIGIPVALAASRLLGGLLYGVSPTDPLVFLGVSLGVLAVAV
jgi:uncharacterized protein YndB with AHSA1/START domain